MDLLELNATIHLDTKEIDEAIEKVERLLALLREISNKGGS